LNPDVLSAAIHITINRFQFTPHARARLAEKQAIDKAAAKGPAEQLKVLGYLIVRQGLAAFFDHDAAVEIDARVMLRFVVGVLGFPALSRDVVIIDWQPVADSDDGQALGKILHAAEARRNHNLTRAIDEATRRKIIDVIEDFSIDLDAHAAALRHVHLRAAIMKVSTRPDIVRKPENHLPLAIHVSKAGVA
jgi:hypothetical protein